MPMLYSLGQHAALQAVQDALLPGEHLFAYLDDIYIVCLPERVTTRVHHQKARDPLPTHPVCSGSAERVASPPPLREHPCNVFIAGHSTQ